MFIITIKIFRKERDPVNETVWGGACGPTNPEIVYSGQIIKQ